MLAIWTYRGTPSTDARATGKFLVAFELQPI